MRLEALKELIPAVEVDKEKAREMDVSFENVEGHVAEELSGWGNCYTGKDNLYFFEDSMSKQTGRAMAVRGLINGRWHVDSPEGQIARIVLVGRKAAEKVTGYDLENCNEESMKILVAECRGLASVGFTDGEVLRDEVWVAPEDLEEEEEEDTSEDEEEESSEEDN